jgi:hypothetical protein
VGAMIIRFDIFIFVVLVITIASGKGQAGAHTQLVKGLVTKERRYSCKLNKCL